MMNKGLKLLCFVIGLFLMISCTGNSESSSKENDKKDSTIKNVSEEKKSASIDSSSSNQKIIAGDDKHQTNSTATLNNLDDFKLVLATSQKWAGGARGSGTGTYYCFTFLGGYSSKQLTVDEVWIGQKHFKTVQSASPIYNRPDFNANDSIFIKVNDIIPGELNRKIYNPDSVAKANIPPPMKYNGLALIGYLLNNQRKYFEVKSFKELPRLNYP